MNKEEFDKKYPKILRVVKEDNRFYPEYYHKSWLGKWFSGWRRFETEELWLHGSFSTLERCDVSYSNLEMAKEHFKTPKKEVIEI